MKTNLLLIADPTADCNAIIADAARQTDRGFIHVTDAGAAFELFGSGVHDIDVIAIEP